MAEGQKASWADWAPGGASFEGASAVARPRLSRGALEASARTWNGVGVAFLILAAVGAIFMGIALTPEKVTGGGIFADTEKDSAAGVAIGVGVFVGSLVTILPYFMFSRVMSALADLLPDAASPGGSPAATSDEAGAFDASAAEVMVDGVLDFPAVADAHPSSYEEARLLLAELDPLPENPEAWLGELCKRIEAGSPPEVAATRIPLDWKPPPWA